MLLPRGGPWLVAVIGMVAGCLFHTEFLLYARCDNGASECDPAWGEKRTPQGCLRPDLEQTAGYCTVECEAASDCPGGEGEVAESMKDCLEVRLEQGEALRRVCVLICDDSNACPEGMVCEAAPEGPDPGPRRCTFGGD